MWSAAVYEAVQGRPAERAQVFQFHPEKNDWESAQTEILVAKEPYAEAQGRHGCILMKEVSDDRMNLLKILIDLPEGGKETPDDVYDAVQRQALAAMTCKLFNANAPEACWSEFLPCAAYELSERDGKPIVRGEQLVTGDTRRRRISMTPASENQEDVRESHIWAAFQVYSYISSDHGLVFDSAVRIGRFWTDVSITSDSGTGGVSDKGVEGLRQWALDFGEKYSRILQVDPNMLLDSMSASEVISLMHKAHLFEDPAKEADPKDIDSSKTEMALRLQFVPSSQTWVKANVKIKIAKVMFANGPRYGCILVKDMNDGEKVRVLKKRIDLQSPDPSANDEEVLDLVQRQMLASTTAKLFRTRAPRSCQPYFVDCNAYQLTNRPQKPMVYVEDMMTTPIFSKKSLSIRPNSMSREDVRESHRWAAFQYFAYFHSGRQMVFDTASHVDGAWTEPTMHSVDQSLGGFDNRGQKGVFAWEFEFEDTYSTILDVDKRHLMKMTPEEMVKRMTDRGLFGDPPVVDLTPVNPKLLKEVESEREFVLAAAENEYPRKPVSAGVDSRRVLIEDELADCPLETCERLTFATETNSWESEKVVVNVAKKLCAFGSKFGCIHVLEPGDKVRVLKKRLDGQENSDDMYDGVKMQGLAALCARLFAAQSPPTCRPRILPCEAIILKQRPNAPAVRIEDFIKGDYEKRELRFEPASAMREDIRDSHKFAAFQYFVFQQAGKGMLIDRISVVSGFWTEPVVFSADKTLGGVADEGSVGISAWEGKFAAKYAPILGMTTDEMWCLPSEEMTRRMDDLGLFDNRDAPEPPRPRPPPPRINHDAEDKKLLEIKQRMKTLEHKKYLDEQKAAEVERPTVSRVYRVFENEPEYRDVASARTPAVSSVRQSALPKGVSPAVAQVLEETVTPITQKPQSDMGDSSQLASDVPAPNGYRPRSEASNGGLKTNQNNMVSEETWTPSVHSHERRPVDSGNNFRYHPAPSHPSPSKMSHSSIGCDQPPSFGFKEPMAHDPDDSRFSTGPTENAYWPARPASGVRLERNLGDAVNSLSFQNSMSMPPPAPTVDWGNYASKARSSVRESAFA